jgi:hypothetical protein
MCRPAFRRITSVPVNCCRIFLDESQVLAQCRTCSPALSLLCQFLDEMPATEATHLSGIFWRLSREGVSSGRRSIGKYMPSGPSTIFSISWADQLVPSALRSLAASGAKCSARADGEAEEQTFVCKPRPPRTNYARGYLRERCRAGRGRRSEGQTHTRHRQIWTALCFISALDHELSSSAYWQTERWVSIYLPLSAPKIDTLSSFEWRLAVVLLHVRSRKKTVCTRSLAHPSGTNSHMRRPIASRILVCYKNF